MPREGIFAVVRVPGDVVVGDRVEVTELGDGTCDRSPEESIRESEVVREANLCKKVAASGGE